MKTNVIETKNDSSLYFVEDETVTKPTLYMNVMWCGTVTIHAALSGLAHLIEHIVWNTIDPACYNNASTYLYTTQYIVCSSDTEDITRIFNKQLFPHGEYITKSISKKMDNINLNNILMEVANEYLTRTERLCLQIDFESLYHDHYSYSGGIFSDLSDLPRIKQKIIEEVQAKYVLNNLRFIYIAPPNTDKTDIDKIVKFIETIPSDGAEIIPPAIIVSKVPWDVVCASNDHRFLTASTRNSIICYIAYKDSIYLTDYLNHILNGVNEDLLKRSVQISSTYYTPYTDNTILHININSNLRLERLYSLVHDYLKYVKDNLRVIHEDDTNTYKYETDIIYKLSGSYIPRNMALIGKDKPDLKSFHDFLKYIVDSFFKISTLFTNSFMFEPCVEKKDVYGTNIQCKKLKSFKFEKAETSSFSIPVLDEPVITNTISYKFGNRGFIDIHTLEETTMGYAILYAEFSDVDTLRILHYIERHINIHYPVIKMYTNEMHNMYYIQLQGPYLDSVLSTIASYLNGQFRTSNLVTTGEQSHDIETAIYNFFNSDYIDHESHNVIGTELKKSIKAEFSLVRINVKANLQDATILNLVNIFRNVNSNTFKFHNTGKLNHDITEIPLRFPCVLVFADKEIPVNILINMKDEGYFYTFEKYRNDCIYYYIIPSITAKKTALKIADYIKANKFNYHIRYNNTTPSVY